MPERIMQAIALPGARVAVKACHASGKTFSAASIALWWTCTGGKTITTAPTWMQVEKLLWGEISAAYQRARFPLGGRLNQTELKFTPECYALGLSTDEGVRFQGFHGRVLIILDEAPGIAPDIWEAIEGIRAGGDVRVLALGNPTIASGPFYDAFGKDRAGWQTFTVDAFDTPNLAGLTVDSLRAMSGPELAIAPRPYLVTRAWVREKLDEWGEDSPLWQSRVRGAFPLQSPDALISLAWLEEAGRRELAPMPSDQLWAGLDVAGPGEAETVLTVRRGGAILPGFPMAWPGSDPRGDVLAALAPYQQQGIQVNVDSIGQGYYLALHLVDAGYIVHAVNVGERAHDPEKYANLKAELYWGLRLWFQQGMVAGLYDEKTISQLSGIRYKHNPQGKVQIESKDEAARRGVASPDRAESMMLCFAPLYVPVLDEMVDAEDVIGHYRVRIGGNRQGW